MRIEFSEAEIDHVLRYMGTPPDRAEEALRDLARQCAHRVGELAEPKWLSVTADVEFTPDGVKLDSGLLLPGVDLARHLEGCRRAVVFCLTLGAQVDAAIRREEHADVLRALALDCAASAAVELLCDQVEETLRARFPGCFFPYRFSPGYGDLPLTVQPALLSLLDAPRRAGLCAGESCILTPRKSVTAILGVSETPVPRHRQRCARCAVFSSCRFRKEGTHCGLS